MAELFSLMPESASCKNDSVEANRTLSQPHLRAFRLSGERCASACGAELPLLVVARRSLPCGKITLPKTEKSRVNEQTGAHAIVARASRPWETGPPQARPTNEFFRSAPVAFRERNSTALWRRPSRSRQLHPISRCPRVRAFIGRRAAGPLSPTGETPTPLITCRARRAAQNSMTEKAAERNPPMQIRQHFQGVYFLSH